MSARSQKKKAQARAAQATEAGPQVQTTRHQSAIRRQVFTLTVTLQAPYLVHGSDPGRHGLHATLLRDHRRRPILPGTLLAGRVAEVWTSHSAALGCANANRWLGTPGTREAKGLGLRARLRVADLVLTQVGGKPFDVHAPTHDFDASRIAVDDDTGSVKRGMLLTVEQVSLPGAELVFSGHWQVWARDDEADMLHRQLWAALQLQTQLGAWRNIGYGRVLKAEVTREAFTTPSKPPTPAKPVATAPHRWADGRRRYALTTDDALCLSASTQRGNVFKSVDHISGGTLKGVLARMLCEQHGVAGLDQLRSQPLAEFFDRVRITHALPTNLDGGRPVPLPQSLVSVGDQGIRDAWELDDLPSDRPGCTLAFQTDWKDKDFDQACASQHWGKTLRHLRVRTDINAQGQAKDEALFAYDCCVADRDPTTDQPLTRWLFEVDLRDVPEGSRQAVEQALNTLLEEGTLSPLGKTDASARVRACEHAPVWPCGVPAGAKALKPGDKVQVLLVTDALLLQTSTIAQASANAAALKLVDLYTDQFAELQQAILGREGSKTHPLPLRYSHHFATQRLAGGQYLHLRYPQKYPTTSPYQPLVLTEAGSVFVFQVENNAADAEVTKVLAQWQSSGLALPPKVGKEHGADWTRHPYLPENGYGEVAVNPAHGFEALSRENLEQESA